ncbi:MAG: DGQHR domain-containing protein [Deferribacterales bacterium]
MTRSEWLGIITTDISKLKNEANERKKTWKELSISRMALEEYQGRGWSIVRELKRIVRVRKLWEHDERLENRVWYLLFLLGFSEMSLGRNFEVTIKKRDAESYRKQIDVLAKDDETVVIAECKSSDSISKNSLQKDIEEYENLKGAIANAVNKHYGNTKKLKILWLFVTNNFAWSDTDKKRANDANIHVVTEKELRYYLQIADHLKNAARFQFLAEFLKNQKIPEMENITVPAVKGKLGGKTYYSFVSTPRQMLKIVFVNHRSLNDPSGAPAYQRLVSKTRLKEVAKFIVSGGFFPTNILVNFEKKCRFDGIAKDEKTNVIFGNLYLPNRYKSAWIIDGQHRLYGFSPLEDKYLDQNIMVIAFEELRKEEEANLFVTINHEQKSVPKTLLDDLEGELKWGSDKAHERIGAICARLIGLLNTDIGEPLYGCVTQQGMVPTEKTCLTVPALKEGLIKSGLVGTVEVKTKEYLKGPLSGSDDNETLDNARSFINSYFQIFVEANPNMWELGRKGYICSNVSLQAHFLLIKESISYIKDKDNPNIDDVSVEELFDKLVKFISPILEWFHLADLKMLESNFKVQYGAGGPKEYFYRLSEILRKTHHNFNPCGFDEWLEEQSEELVSEANRKIKELNIKVQKTIFDILRETYGDENDAYWDKGIKDKEIKAGAYKKSLEDSMEERLPLENYLEFIEYKKIVENKDHWLLFKQYFNIPEKGEKGISKNLKWMDRINELRRIPAHPTEKRQYKSKDFEYINYIYTNFMRMISEREKIND